MFIFVASIISVSLIFQFLKIKKLKKYDRYLYNFCSLRKEVMNYLRVNHDIISKSEYESIKQIIVILNDTINIYSKNKMSTIFNFRRFAKYVKNTKDLVESSKKIECDNPTINNFRNSLNKNIIITFFAYTPFLLEEVFLRIVYLVVLILIKMGLRKLINLKNKLFTISQNCDDIEFYRKNLVC